MEEVEARPKHHAGGRRVAERQRHAVVGGHDERRQHPEKADGPVLCWGLEGVGVWVWMWRVRVMQGACLALCLASLIAHQMASV